MAGASQRMVRRRSASKNFSWTLTSKTNRTGGLFWTFFIWAHFSEGGIDRGNESVLHKTSLEQASGNTDGDWNGAFGRTLLSRGISKSARSFGAAPRRHSRHRNSTRPAVRRNPR